LSNCPNFVSSRETITNIKLITASMSILKRSYLGIDQIRHGINSYLLVCRETKEDHLYFRDGRIHRALRLMNLSISDNLLKLWYEHVKTNLEYAKKEKRDFEKEHKEARVDIPFIMPHEFLFLLCNCLNRLEIVNKVHKPDFSSKFGDVY
jgi:hypothetical protein